MKCKSAIIFASAGGSRIALGTLTEERSKSQNRLCREVNDCCIRRTSTYSDHMVHLSGPPTASFFCISQIDTIRTCRQDNASVWKKTLLRRRRRRRSVGRPAFRVSNRAPESSFCCWFARQSFAQKECLFHRHRCYVELGGTRKLPRHVL